jgi:hypothetical protein
VKRAGEVRAAAAEVGEVEARGVAAEAEGRLVVVENWEGPLCGKNKYLRGFLQNEN